MRDDHRARPLHAGATNGEAGFTMVEIVLSLSTLLLAVVVVGLGLPTGFRVQREIRESEVVLAQGQAFLDKYQGKAALGLIARGDITYDSSVPNTSR